MDLQEALNRMKTYQLKMSAYNYVSGIIGWDAATFAPKASASYRSKMVGSLAEDHLTYQLDPQNIAMLEFLSEKDEVDPKIKRAAKIYLNDIDKVRNLPKNLYAEHVETVSMANRVWEEAKKTDNYALFEPYLKKIIDFSKKALEYRNASSKPYDTLLNDFEEGMDSKSYDAFFDTLKKELVPFIKKVHQDGAPIDDSLLYREFPIEKQKEMVSYLISYLKFDLDRGGVAESVHPFTNPLSSGDSRITVRYLKNYFPASLFACVHESGHALANQQMDPSLEGTGLQDTPSLGIGESQSRFYENYIGRSLPFWETNYPRFQELFPAQTKDLPVEEFHRIINRSKPTLIRMEADELTYPMHIIVRYEMEKMMVEQDVDTKKLPQIWNDKYEEYLGIRPQTDREGILQDVHWADEFGFGYFPTYAIGTAYGAQFLHAMKKDFSVEDAVRAGETEKVHNWLKTHINFFGKFYTPKEILINATGEPFDPRYFIDYLKEKYTKIYFA